MICKCCDNETKGTETCSIEHGMAWRFLKNKNLTKDQIKEILSVRTEHSIKTKYILWTQGLLEEPRCEICGSKLSIKKLNSTALSSKTCSKNCYAFKKEHNSTKQKCIICGNINCKEQKCTSIKRELKKVKKDVSLYIKELNKKYNHLNIDLLMMNKLYLNNLSDFPECKYCGEPNHNVFNETIYDCCSQQCGTAYKKYKKSYKSILKYYIQKGIPESFKNN